MVKQIFDTQTQTGQQIPADFSYHGIVAGKPYFLDHSLPPMDERFVDRILIDSERQDLEDARMQTIEQFKKRISDAQSSMSPQDARQIKELLDYYILLLGQNDDLMIHANIFISGRKPAATAIRLAAQKFAGDVMESAQKIRSIRFQAKSDDILNTGNWMARNILNIPQPDLSMVPEKSVIIADSLSPAELIYFPTIKPAGVILRDGSPSGHVGDYCAGEHVSCAFIGNDKAFQKLRNVTLVVMNGIDGYILPSPTAGQLRHFSDLKEVIERKALEFQKIVTEPAVTMDGRNISLLGTIAMPSDANQLQNFGAPAIGLDRTEAALLSGHIPDEQTQRANYREVLNNAGNIPVTFRTYDLEGDKTRGLSLDSEDKLGILHTQYRALLAEAAEYPSRIKIMIPNIRLQTEAVQAKALLTKTYEAMKSAGESVPGQLPEFGIMIETPSVARGLRSYKGIVDFVSIGTNDLPASHTKADRNNADFQPYLDLLQPENLDLIHDLIAQCEELEIPYSLCGTGAADARLTSVWIGMNATNLCVPYGAYLEVKDAVRKTDFDKAVSLVEKLLEPKMWQEGQRTPVERNKDIVNRHNAERNIGLTSNLGAEDTKPAGDSPDLTPE